MLVTLSFRIIASLLVLAILSACSGTVQQKQVIPDARKTAQPAWLENPELAGYLTVVGSAMPQSMGGIEGQRRAAMLRARAQLAKSARVFVTKSLSIQKQGNQNAARVNQKINTRAVEMQQLNNARVKAEWVSPQSRELFIWYVIPIRE